MPTLSGTESIQPKVDLNTKHVHLLTVEIEFSYLGPTHICYINMTYTHVELHLRYGGIYLYWL